MEERREIVRCVWRLNPVKRTEKVLHQTHCVLEQWMLSCGHNHIILKGIGRGCHWNHVNTSWSFTAMQIKLGDRVYILYLPHLHFQHQIVRNSKHLFVGLSSKIPGFAEWLQPYYRTIKQIVMIRIQQLTNIRLVGATRTCSMHASVA